jgi:hypothetical protein
MMTKWFPTQRMEVFTGLTSQGGARRMSTASGFSVAVAIVREATVICPMPWLIGRMSVP